MAGRGASTTSGWLKDLLYPILVKPVERILQSQDWDMQSLLKRFFKKRDEASECGECGDRPLAAIISSLVELSPGLAQPGKEEAEG